MDAEVRLLTALASADILFGYAPLGDEPDPGQYLRAHTITKPGISILPVKDTSAEATAESLGLRAVGKRVCIFVPGRMFDETGTRHGRGAGWYDRFLSHAPKSWVRIGVAGAAHMSKEKLVRKEWDEPMDFILVNDGGWKAFKATVRD